MQQGVTQKIRFEPIVFNCKHSPSHQTAVGWIPQIGNVAVGWRAQVACHMHPGCRKFRPKPWRVSKYDDLLSRYVYLATIFSSESISILIGGNLATPCVSAKQKYFPGDDWEPGLDMNE